MVVPCGQAKIWEKEPTRGPTAARYIYTGPPFIVNKLYAEKFGERWVILSAKYGFISPDTVIPGPYNVTFKKSSTNPVSVSILKDQIQKELLDKFKIVVGLGGKEYRAAIQEAFASSQVTLQFPFAGLPIGKAMQATTKAIKANQPRFEVGQVEGT